jgi:hypothetical protein
MAVETAGFTFTTLLDRSGTAVNLAQHTAAIIILPA